MASKLTDLKTPVRNWGYCLTISGSPYRYYDRVPPPAGNVNKAAGIVYRDIPALIRVGAVGGEIDFTSGVASATPLSLTLAANPATPWADGVPALVFGVTTPDGCEWSSYLTAEVSRTDSTLSVAESPSTLSYPCLVHVDMESIYVTGYTGLDITGGVRGAARTLIQRHSYADENTLTGVSSSLVTSQIITWMGRICTVHAVPIFWNGAHGEWVELFHGMMEDTPACDDGISYTLSLAPITAVLNQPPASPSDLSAETRLARGWHYFSFPRACMLEHQQDIPISGIGGEIWAAPIDPSLTATNDAALLQWPEDLFGFNDWTQYPTTSLLTSVFTEDGVAVRRYASSTTTYRLIMNLGERPGYSEFDDGASNTGGYSEAYRYVEPSWRLHAPFRAVYRDGAREVPLPNLDGLNPDCYGVSVAPGKTPTLRLQYALAFYQRGEPFLLLENAVEENITLEVTLRDTEDPRVYRVKIGTVTATALPTGGTRYRAAIESGDRYVLPSFCDWGDPETAPIIRALAVFEEDAIGSLLLGLLTSGGGGFINGNYDSEPIGYNLPSPSRTGVSVSAWGDLVLVDEDSFLTIVPPPLLDKMTLSFSTTFSESLFDLISSTLLAARYVLTAGTTADGYCRIRAVPITGGSGVNVVKALTDADFIDEQIPVVGYDNAVVTAYTFTFNYGADGSPGITITIADNQAMRSYGKMGSLDLPLRGVVWDDPRGVERSTDLAAGMFATLREYLKAPNRIITVSLPNHIAAFLPLGALVRLTSTHLPARTPPSTMSGVYARLVRISTDLASPGSLCAFAEIEAGASGYNAAATVSLVISTTVLRFALYTYGDSINPETGEAATDLDLFQPGDSVFLYKVGARDAGVVRVISSISTNGNIEFTAAHGFVSGDRPIVMEPDYYGGGAVLADDYLFNANTAGVLTPSDPGTRIS